MKIKLALVQMVKSYGGVLGAAVSCSDAGGTPTDHITTCGDDMPKLLDVVFSLAKNSPWILIFIAMKTGTSRRRVYCIFPKRSFAMSSKDLWSADIAVPSPLSLGKKRSASFMPLVKLVSLSFLSPR